MKFADIVPFEPYALSQSRDPLYERPLPGVILDASGQFGRLGSPYATNTVGRIATHKGGRVAPMVVVLTYRGAPERFDEALAALSREDLAAYRFEDEAIGAETPFGDRSEWTLGATMARGIVAPWADFIAEWQALRAERERGMQASFDEQARDAETAEALTAQIEAAGAVCPEVKVHSDGRVSLTAEALSTLLDRLESRG